MTLSQMLLDLTARIGVENGQEVSNTNLTNWLNEAMRVFLEEDTFNWAMKRVTSSSIANQEEYALPDDVLRPVELRVNGSTSTPNVYEYVPYQERFGITSGVHGFSVLGSSIFVPGITADGTNNMELTYVRRPTNMVDGGDSPSDADIANMPEAYHPALVCYAFAIYNGYDEEAADSQYWLGNPVNPSPGTYNWFVRLAKRANTKMKTGGRRKMLSKQAAVGYSRVNQVGVASPVLGI